MLSRCVRARSLFQGRGFSKDVLDKHNPLRGKRLCEIIKYDECCYRQCNEFPFKKCDPLRELCGLIERRDETWVANLNRLPSYLITPELVDEAINFLRRGGLSYRYRGINGLLYESGPISAIYCSFIKEHPIFLKYLSSTDLDDLLSLMEPDFFTMKNLKLCASLSGASYNKYFAERFPLYFIVKECDHSLLENTTSGNLSNWSYYAPLVPDPENFLENFNNKGYMHCYRQVIINDKATLHAQGNYNYFIINGYNPMAFVGLGYMSSIISVKSTRMGADPNESLISYRAKSLLIE